jgi:uncharacterized protein
VQIGQRVFMTGYDFTCAGAELTALPSGALWWPAERLLAVADLHLGKAERIARRGGSLLPPFETADTLARLDVDIAATQPATVVCLGDTFDDRAAAEALPEEALLWIARLQAGREWIWVEGNHDPGPLALALAGTHRAALALGPLIFRHIADAAANGEVSGHYHPKARIAAPSARIARPCFLIDAARVILPAYGTYTGGLPTDSAALSDLMRPGARAVLLGKRLHAIPMPRRVDRQGRASA